MALQATDLLYVLLDDGTQRQVTWSDINTKQVPNTCKLVCERKVGSDFEQFAMPVTDIWANRNRDDDLFMTERGLTLYHTTLRAEPFVLLDLSGYSGNPDHKRPNVTLQASPGETVKIYRPGSDILEREIDDKAPTVWIPTDGSTGQWRIVGTLQQFKIDGGEKNSYVNLSFSTGEEWNNVLANVSNMGHETFMHCKELDVPDGLIMRNAYKTFYNTTVKTTTTISNMMPVTGIKTWKKTFQRTLLGDENGGAYIDLNHWDVSDGKDFTRMFEHSELINVNVNNWDMANCTNISGMFRNTTTLNINVSKWDMSNVVNMAEIFYQCRRVDRDSVEVSGWNTKSVKDFSRAFGGCCMFNQNITKWDTSNVENMFEMFSGAVDFSRKLNAWDVRKVNNMTNMFRDATSMTGDCSEWCVSQFSSQPVGFDTNCPMPANKHPKWGHCALQSERDPMIAGPNGEQGTISPRDAMSVTQHGQVDRPATYTCSWLKSPNTDRDDETPYDSWSVVSTDCTSYQTTDPDINHRFVFREEWVAGPDYISLYSNELTPNLEPLGPDSVYFIVHKGTARFQANNPTGPGLRSTLYKFRNGGWTDWFVMDQDYPEPLSQGLYGFQTGPGQDYCNGFRFGELKWDPNKYPGDEYEWVSDPTAEVTLVEQSCMAYITDAYSMFCSLKTFNQDLRWWNKSNLTNMKQMFEGCETFNHYVDSWDVSNCTDFHGVFANCANFNKPVNNWNVSNGQWFEHVFSNCQKFNQKLDKWDITNAQRCTYFLYNCKSFNTSIMQPVFKRDCDLMGFFGNCETFNQKLDGWDVSKSHRVAAFFYGCKAFNQKLPNFHMNRNLSIRYMFAGMDNFNQPVDHLNIGHLTEVEYAFLRSPKFNQSLANWNIVGTGNCSAAFSGASAFKQDLSHWDLTACNPADLLGSQFFYDCPNARVKSYWPKGLH